MRYFEFLVWAAMHHPEPIEFRLESPILIDFRTIYYPGDLWCEIGLRPPRLTATVPWAIVQDYEAKTGIEIQGHIPF